MTTPERATIFIVTGLTILFLTWFLPKSKWWLPDWVTPSLGIIGLIIGVGGAIGLGQYFAALGLRALRPNDGILADILLCSAAIIGPVYLFVLCTQFVANLARAIRGEPLNRIEWIKGINR